jgi:N-acetylglucosaminyldiphosphoundecaprenol N-acetyl-beta-D-mannosaminyltransferase
MNLNRDVYCILGLPFDAANLDEAVYIVNTGVGSTTACFLSTPNLNFIIAAMSDDAFFSQF